MDEIVLGKTPGSLWLQTATDQDVGYDDPDDEAEPLEDDHYPDNDEYEEVPEEDEL